MPAVRSVTISDVVFPGIVVFVFPGIVIFIPGNACFSAGIHIRFSIPRQRYHAIARGEVHQPYAHGLPAGLLDLAGPGPDDAAG